MNIDAALDWLEATKVAEFIQLSSWAFPAIESVHVIALVLVVGTILVVDFRLMGLASRSRSVAELSRDILPWTWGAFALAAVSGTLLFISNAGAYWHNLPFRLKFLLMLLAGLNMLAFHFVIARDVSRWGPDRPVPVAGRVAGGLSCLFWIGIIAMGRWIGFTMVVLPF